MRKTFYDFKANVDLELPSRVRLNHRLGEYDTLADKEANFVQDIIDGGDAYDKVSHLVSTATKNELRP